MQRERQSCHEIWDYPALVALAGAIFTLANLTAASAGQSAPLTFCNKTPDKVGVAIGYFTPGLTDPADHSILTGPFVSRGWSFFEPGQCGMFPNPFGARYMFWFGFSKGYHDSEIAAMFMRNPDLPLHFCVTSYFVGDTQVPAFTYEDENASVAACDLAGGVTPSERGHTLVVTPQTVDTWVNATVNFTGQ
jgi:hypothetical protein